MDSRSASAWRSLIWPSFSDSASAISAFLTGGFCDFSPPAPFTSPANFFCGDSAGVADGVEFSSSPSPGDGDGVSCPPSPGLGDSSACRCPGDGEGWFACCFAAPGDGEGLSLDCCCCFFCGSFFAWDWSCCFSSFCSLSLADSFCDCRSCDCCC